MLATAAATFCCCCCCLCDNCCCCCLLVEQVEEADDELEHVEEEALFGVVLKAEVEDIFELVLVTEELEADLLLLEDIDVVEDKEGIVPALLEEFILELELAEVALFAVLLLLELFLLIFWLVLVKRSGDTCCCC